MIDAGAFLWVAGGAGQIPPRDLFETGVEKDYEQTRPDYLADPAVDANAEPWRSFVVRATRKLGEGILPEEITDREIRALAMEDRVPPWIDLGAHLRGETDAFDEENRNTLSKESIETIGE